MKTTLCHSFTCVSMLSLSTLLSAPSAQAGCDGLKSSITNLPAVGNNVYQANALNSAGQITGSFSNDTVMGEAFLYSGGNLVDLGTLGGSFSQGRALNSAGVVVGDSQDNSGESHAALFDGISAFDLGTLGGAASSAGAINDNGQIIGSSLTSDPAIAQEALLYSNGSLVGLGTFGGFFSSAFSINNPGAVVGESADASGDIHAFVYTNGAMQDLGTLGGNYSAAFVINDSGTIAGESGVNSGDVHPFLYINGVMSDLGNFGGSYASAYLLNQANQASGIATTPDGNNHGFFYANGTMTDLGSLGGTNLFPNAMNNNGQVVGQADTASGGSHAFLWQNGTLLDLNSILPANSGWELNSALYINDSGRIVGTGQLNGVDQTFVMDISPANSAPTAVAGANQTVECGTLVTLDGSASSDPDGDALSYQWTSAGFLLGTNATLTGYFAAGINLVTLTVTDPCNASSQAAVTVTVNDTTPPTISGPASITVAVDNNCQGTVPNVLSSVIAADNCTPANQLIMTQNPAAGTSVPKGQSVIVVTVSDLSGNQNSVGITLSVVDQTAPVIQSATATPSVISPPNHMMVPVTVLVCATDNCDSAPVSQIVSITCSEPVQPGEIVITGNLTASLAATRNNGNRVYTLTIQCTDNSGNSSQATVTVTVPQGKKNP